MKLVAVFACCVLLSSVSSAADEDIQRRLTKRWTVPKGLGGSPMDTYGCLQSQIEMKKRCIVDNKWADDMTTQALSQLLKMDYGRLNLSLEGGDLLQRIRNIRCSYLIKIVDMCSNGGLVYNPSVVQAVIKVCAEDPAECQRYWDRYSVGTVQNRIAGR